MPSRVPALLLCRAPVSTAVYRPGGGGAGGQAEAGLLARGVEAEWTAAWRTEAGTEWGRSYSGRTSS